MANLENPLFKLFSPACYKTTKEIYIRGEGAYLYSEDGTRYLDFVQGIGVNNLGHCHPRIVEAIRNQAGQLIHASFNLGYYPTALQLAKKLSEQTPGNLNMFFFSNSGAEAVEGAIKLARYQTERSVYIAFRGSFHGRTMGALSMTASTSSFRARYEPMLPTVHHLSYPYCFRCPYKQQPNTCSLECLDEFQRLFHHVVPPAEVALVLFEPAQGEGGYIVPPKKYVTALASLCKEKDILLGLDEIQTGLGRTGRMFAIEHFDVVPDITLIGKGLAAGLPLSAVCSSEKLMGSWPPGAHGGTFGANPVACASSLAYLEVIKEENLLDNCSQIGKYFKEQLEKLQNRFPIIGDVRGLGLFLAIELTDSKGAPDSEITQKIIHECHEAGLLLFSCGSYKNCIRFMPPLNITSTVVDESLAILENAFKRICQ